MFNSVTQWWPTAAIGIAILVVAGVGRLLWRLISRD
jgi:hypothetical protein